MTWLKAASSSRCETRFAWLISYRHTYLYTYLSTYPSKTDFRGEPYFVCERAYVARYIIPFRKNT